MLNNYSITTNIFIMGPTYTTPLVHVYGIHEKMGGLQNNCILKGLMFEGK